MSERFQQLRAATRSRFRIDFRSISTIAGRYRIDFGRVSHRFQASQAAAMSISKGFPVDWNRCKALPERCRIDFRLQKHSKQWKQYRESSVNEGCKRMASETSAPPPKKSDTAQEQRNYRFRATLCRHVLGMLEILPYSLDTLQKYRNTLRHWNWNWFFRFRLLGKTVFFDFSSILEKNSFNFSWNRNGHSWKCFFRFQQNFSSVSAISHRFQRFHIDFRFQHQFQFQLSFNNRISFSETEKNWKNDFNIH